MRHDGIAAPMFLDGPMNAESFLAYVEQALAPELRPAMSSTWTICQRIKSTASNKASKRSGASLRYLPPHSPDFGPIEMAFAKLETLLRAAAARTILVIWHAIANALRRFTP